MPTILKPRPIWTGKQVFSLFIPRAINLIRFSAGTLTARRATCPRGHGGAGGAGGGAMWDPLQEEHGSAAGGLVHTIWEEVGPDAARKFLGHTQWLVNYWLLQQGFSIGIGDTIADASTMETINETIAKARTRSRS
ncbi:hypothetical protein CLOM_g9457 [Closterium sp. NIES-68]|nr:hypothetical protein CLOM_g9457 [Closterium sp. NIES-68]